MASSLLTGVEKWGSAMLPLGKCIAIELGGGMLVQGLHQGRKPTHF
jgi:hypothetical protein